MGCDIHAFVEIESGVAGEFDSLFYVEWGLPRHYEVFAALAGVRCEAKPLFPPRGIPSGLGAFGFRACYRQIVCHTDALGYRGSNFVLPYEVGKAEVFPASVSERWGVSKLGYILATMEVPSWLSLSELVAAVEHAGIRISELSVEYQFLISVMSNAEKLLSRMSRIVFWFDSV
jgi:hypothetical protein